LQEAELIQLRLFISHLKMNDLFAANNLIANHGRLRNEFDGLLSQSSAPLCNLLHLLLGRSRGIPRKLFADKQILRAPSGPAFATDY
jgi:hypothetical protein